MVLYQDTGAVIRVPTRLFNVMVLLSLDYCGGGALVLVASRSTDTISY